MLIDLLSNMLKPLLLGIVRWYVACALAVWMFVINSASGQETGMTLLPPPSQQVTPIQFVDQFSSPPAAAPRRVSARQIQVLPRYDGGGSNLETLTTPDGQNIVVLTGGVHILIQDVQGDQFPGFLGPVGTVDIETDRAVIWLQGGQNFGLGGMTFNRETPLEIYLEGNIEFRQGERTVFAERMFYDVSRETGVILDAELLTPIPTIGDYDYRGLVRLKADSIRQLNSQQFLASNALVTTSRLEVPSYHLGAEQISFRDTLTPAIDPETGAVAVDPSTGQPLAGHRYDIESRNNYLYLGNIPIFYWPTIATDLTKPTYYIDNLRVRNDSIFGTQVLLELDAFQLLGLAAAPVGTEWDLNLDWLSDRGLGFGTSFRYGRDDLFGIQGRTNGFADLWLINEQGVDNLGLGRRSIAPEEDLRGRIFWNHQQKLRGGILDDWLIQAEVGWISDRTFLEQYYEYEYDQQPDQLTGVRLKRTANNQTFSAEAYGQLNDFYTQTQWLPRGDHWWLGESLLGDSLTWMEHTTLGVGDVQVATNPTNPVLGGIFDRLPWEEDAAGVAISSTGERLLTRQELDFPINVAPWKVVPYVLGEAGHWGSDVNGNDIQRLYYQAGMRASIPFWGVNPMMRDPLFNLNGLAHKIVFDAEVSYADANRNINQFPLYDPLDDDVIEEFRRRLFFPGFGGSLAGVYYLPGAPSSIDPRFDPRFYALRSGLGGHVTSPSPEIADDLMTVRLGMRHRLQTKRGAIGSERIVDWLTFDSNITWFPRADEDNFGEDFGLIDYDLRWHLGDRFTILSDGFADLFGDGLRTASIGGLINRPSRGNLYLGYRAVDGPFESNVVTATLNYRSSPKWVLSASTMFDLSGTGNIGQSFGGSRIGESIIATLGIRVDESKNNLSASFLIEPRFLPKTNLMRKTGLDIPPVGYYGIE